MNIYIYFYFYKTIELILESNLSEPDKIVALFFVVLLSLLPFIIHKLLS